jgi:sulfoxide reductase heme-binding subunit YedZ
MTIFLSRAKRLLQKHWLWLAANAGALFPLAWLAWDYFQDNLSVNPIADITARTGQPAIILLMLSLACTPVNIISGYARVLTLRRSLGLYAFMYACLHFLTFVGLDYGFNLEFILGDALLEKRYIIVGLAALLILIPLAITSTRGWMKRLGRNWKRLHQLVYVAGGLAVFHFLWLVKATRLYEPLIYAVILTVLLVIRIPPVRRFFVGLRRRPAPARPLHERKTRPITPRVVESSAPK